MRCQRCCRPGRRRAARCASRVAWQRRCSAGARACSWAAWAAWAAARGRCPAPAAAARLGRTLQSSHALRMQQVHDVDPFRDELVTMFSTPLKSCSVNPTHPNDSSSQPYGTHHAQHLEICMVWKKPAKPMSKHRCKTSYVCDLHCTHEYCVPQSSPTSRAGTSQLLYNNYTRGLIAGDTMSGVYTAHLLFC